MIMCQPKLKMRIYLNYCIPQDMLHEMPGVKLIVTNVKNYLGTKVTL